jgi:mannose/fructose/N-acetylgalactosamine-specific phosphotransferase system component IIC
VFGNLLLDAIFISFAGALLSLDRTAAFQTMAGRPLVSAPIIGFIAGSAQAGLVVGVTLELLLMGDLPVGTYVPSHETGLAVLTTAVTVAAINAMGIRPFNPIGYVYTSMAVIPLALIVSLPVARAYRYADTLARRFNALIFHLAERSIGAPSGGGNLVKFNLYGLVVFFAALWAAFLVTVFPLLLITRYIFTGAVFPRFLHAAFAGTILLGVASALTAVGTSRKELVFFAAGAAAPILMMVI